VVCRKTARFGQETGIHRVSLLFQAHLGDTGISGRLRSLDIRFLLPVFSKHADQNEGDD